MITAGYAVKIPRPQRDLDGQDLYSSSGTCVPCKTPDINKAWVFYTRVEAEGRANALPQMNSPFPGCRPVVLEVRRTIAVATEILGPEGLAQTNSLCVEDGVMVMRDSKSWGLVHEDGHSTTMGWVDAVQGRIRDPEFCKSPTGLTYAGSPDSRELATGRLVKVRRVKILEVLGDIETLGLTEYPWVSRLDLKTSSKPDDDNNNNKKEAGNG